MAWRLLDDTSGNSIVDKSNYYWINADIVATDNKGYPVKDDKGEFVKGQRTLGLIGMHLVKSTPDHPEMIWATFEHKSNTTECVLDFQRFDHSYSFLTDKGSSALMIRRDLTARAPLTTKTLITIV